MNRNHLLHKCQGLSTCHFLVNKEFQHDNILGCYWPCLFPRTYWSECKQSRTAIVCVLLQLRGFLPASVEMCGMLWLLLSRLICPQPPDSVMMKGRWKFCSCSVLREVLYNAITNPKPKCILLFFWILECNKNMYVLPLLPLS